MRYPTSLLEDIRARLPLSQIVGRRVTWDRRKSQPAKGDYWACCPFHGEKTPSFHADDRRGRYHCFGCGKGGDHFTFLTEIEGVTFPEAVERLAAEAGVPLPAPDPQTEARERKQLGLAEVMEAATQFYDAELASPRGASVRSYLEGRRITREVQQRFRLGYAGPGRNALKEHLAGKGFSQEIMTEAGLLVTGDDIPVSFDRFRDRVIFPIADFRGRIVGLGGRALSPDAQAKYLNSPETPLFHKGSLLYHGREAREAARSAGTVIAVEGYVDVIALATAGFPHVVAPLGTALTETQLQLLWRMAPEPILCFDGDSAGVRAARRALDLALPALGPDRSLRFALLPEGVDPDDVVGQSGPAAMKQLLETAMPAVEMLWDRETEDRRFDTPERRAGLEKRLAAAIQTIGDEAVRRHYKDALAARLRAFFGEDQPAQRPIGALPRRAFRRPNDNWRGAQARGPTTPRYRPADPLTISPQLRRRARQGGAGGPTLAEATLLTTLIHHPVLLHRHLDDLLAVELTSPELVRLRGAIISEAADNKEEKPVDVALSAAGFSDLIARLDGIVERAGAWQALAGSDDADAEQGWLQAITLHRRARALHKELAQAEAAYAGDMSEPNFARMIEIQRQLTNAEGTEASIEGFGRSSGRQAQDY
jgi:DNA primase